MVGKKENVTSSANSTQDHEQFSLQCVDHEAC